LRKIAIIGGGISGLVAAYVLGRRYEVRLFEAEKRLGGHTRTETVHLEDQTFEVDTGFIVFNEPNYPGFCRLLGQLGVESRPTEMSFSVSCPRTGLEYAGHTLNTLFAQRSNLWNGAFLRMLADLLRFNRRAKAVARGGGGEGSLGDFLAAEGFSDALADWYVLPMGASLWSASRQAMRDFPLGLFVRFLDNHALLDLWGRPRWRTIRGGSQRYVERLQAQLGDRVQAGRPVASVSRSASGVELRFPDQEAERFDAVVMALHSDQALALLTEPTPSESEILGALPYEANDILLHTDASVLPKNRRAWASWNYRLGEAAQQPATVTYNMNILQGLRSREVFCVTLNQRQAVDPRRILRRLRFDHPRYTLAGDQARARRGEIQGRDRTYFCGAYWGNGFHEDGVQSALAVSRDLGLEL
jgi:predicted NAD/FAD-binding protein